jgi:hypothetical protein
MEFDIVPVEAQGIMAERNEDCSRGEGEMGVCFVEFGRTAYVECQR